MRHLTALLLGLAVVLTAACKEKGEPVRFTFADGTLNGLQYQKTEAYRGVPFARPPLGELRWKPPVQNVAFGELDATESRDKCTQLELGTINVAADSSEDCLYLNVFRPRTEGTHPVMVFFPGGAYVIDGNRTATYDGRKLAEAGDVLVVVANYRLGPLGWAAHPALTAERDLAVGTSGDYGLEDQREALRWVKRNIAAFGGDPNRVTIFGESAGAGSVCAHVLSGRSEGLFHAAIMESPPCTGFPMPTLAEGEAQGQALAAALGCNGDAAATLACMRGKSKDEVVKALPLHQYVIYGPGVAWGPLVDGNNAFVMQPIEAFASGTGNNVPIIVGANSDEGELFFAKNESVATEADIRAMLSELFASAVVDAVVAHYPIPTDGSGTAKTTAVRILNDIFSCDARRIARQWSARGNATYHYFFARKFYDIVLDLGAFHGADLAFVFGNAVSGLPVLPQGKPLRDAMQSYWTTFARTDDPNGAGFTTWPRYEAATDKSLQLDVPISEQANIRQADCDFWDTQRP